jgi:uncharacterized protein YjbI with pentapeptide repeats
MRWLISLAAMLAFPVPALAQGQPPCIAMLGDFWGETPPPDAVKTIDGTAYKTPQELTRSVGQGAVVKGGNFSEWDFRNVRLAKACFVDANLKGSVWTNADAPGVGFITSDLSEALLTGINAPGVLFRDAVLTNVKADKADFTGGQLEGGWFEGSIDGWNIDGANLTDFTFSCGITLSDGCPLYNGDARMTARGANLTRARLSSFHRYGLTDIALDGAIIDRTELSPGQLGSLAGRTLAHAIVLVGGDNRAEITGPDAMTLIADSAAYAAGIARPSFDCAKASSAVEKLLCDDNAGDLAVLDRRLGTVFAQARAAQPAIIAQQRTWLKQRDGCVRNPYPSDCLRTVYEQRIGALLGVLGERDWLVRGQGALFIDDDLPLSDTMRASPLFARIAPVLASASMARVYVTREADGSYSVSGDAVGANAHTCTLGAAAMRLDPLTGWYSARDPQARRNARVVRVMGDQLDVFANGRPDGDLPEAQMDYASCGARAAFTMLRRIHLPADILKPYANSVSSEQ